MSVPRLIFSFRLLGCLAVVVLMGLVDGAAAGPADDTLTRLLAEDLDEMMRRSPTWASSRGDRRFDDRLPEPGAQARAEWLAHTKRRLEAARALDAAELAPAHRTNKALFEYELARRLSQARFHPEQMPVTQMSGPQQWLPQLAADLGFTETKHFEDYVARLEAVPAYLDAVQADMEAGLAAGRTPPRVAIRDAARQALAHGTEEQAKNPRLHAMWPPFDAAREKSPLAARAEVALRERVVPAFRKFGTFLRDRYLPGCRESLAASGGVDGRAYYDAQLRHHTTTDLDADAIHALGRAEVARIRAEMLAVIARTDFAPPEGADDDARFRAFVTYLRTNPRFYFERPEDLLAGYRELSKRIDGLMPRFFGKLPRLPYGVKEMPKYIAPAAPTAYYYRGSLKTGKAGFFVANTYKLDQRPRYEMVPLTLHEAVPGHHHQNALAQELEGLPEWRTTLSYNAFGEGWALYAERLGVEMGLYEDPYDDFGRLSYEMWRAMRLVVDTGLHAQGWSRQQAIDYMLANSALTEDNVASEVDRYIAWPGQATAYKIGELKIRELRARAEARLGDAFDLRAFHDALLDEGSLPLPVLEAKIDAWIAAAAR